MRTSPVRALARIAGSSLVALSLGGVATTLAADEPVFKSGQWQFDRTVQSPGAAPQKLSKSRCTEPNAEFAMQRQKLAKLGCQVTPTARSGATYHYTATCQLGGVTAISDNVLKVDGPESYSITVDSTTGPMKTHEVLVARRVGDCAR